VVAVTPANELSPSDVSRVECLRDSLFPRVLPSSWQLLEDYSNAAHYMSGDGLGVIAEVELHDGDAWLHVSFSRRSRIPSYEDMARVKSLFVGDDRKAIQVLPAKTEHFNLHPFCLHLYSPIDRDPLPDFRRKDGGL
jgi:hypothetical protein